ncbi:MAG: SIMPL domain-containing protein [Oscillospiraceae bacterium]|nr:SIMPL domain-containing protein [Oscillospiraceae bacterium]
MKRTITVKGVGTASAKPDFIVISMNIVSKDPEYVKAVANANERIALLQNAIIKAGFVKEDLKTLSFNVRTAYKNEQNERGMWVSVFDGYECRYRLKLSMDMDAKRLADTLTEISDSKADAEFNIEFTVKNPEEIGEAVLRSATENAKRKAKILCEASGEKLGELISIDYDWSDIHVASASVYSAGNMVRGIAEDAAMPEFEPEDIRSSDSVTFIWEID